MDQWCLNFEFLEGFWCVGDMWIKSNQPKGIHQKAYALSNLGELDKV